MYFNFCWFVVVVVVDIETPVVSGQNQRGESGQCCVFRRLREEGLCGVVSVKNKTQEHHKRRSTARAQAYFEYQQKSKRKGISHQPEKGTGTEGKNAECFVFLVPVVRAAIPQEGKSDSIAVENVR